ncbi:hypothetical protein GCM10025789_01620 [Tessaracoccus lubricantis]|uniref:Phenol hydroxylase-like C-terminal dimerisation domain-containing protein n=1 Tax=Tessaracoccus lubricantis TaxID=545543 RepID=A0ABP9EXI0_9ACTN
MARVCDGNPLHLGHQARADGRWRLYAFADVDGSGLDAWAQWLAGGDDSPVVRYTPEGADVDSVFDVRAIYQQAHEDVDLMAVPAVFKPEVGPFRLTYLEKVYARLSEDEDIFAERAIDRGGAVVVARPDQYVAHVLPLHDTAALAAFFERNLLSR